MDSSIWIVEERPNPSTEYYILPALTFWGYTDKINIHQFPPKVPPKQEVFLYFVRYITPYWVNFVKKNRGFIKKIIYFMDDDLFDIKSWIGLPLRYQKKLFFKAYIWKKWLIKSKAIFMVSTPYLAEKYNFLNPIYIPPYPFYELTDLKPKDTQDIHSPIIFYHGTASHMKELYWLYDVIKDVIQANKKAIFELICDNKVLKNFKSLEKVIIFLPMNWNLYKEFLFRGNRDIGLVPLLDYPFNLARSYTKFFEVVASGGVGIYSEESYYREIISNGIDGLLVRTKKDEWKEAIFLLIRDEALRKKLYFNSLKKVEILKSIAEDTYKKIFHEVYL